MRTGSPALGRWMLALCLTATYSGWLLLADQPEPSRAGPEKRAAVLLDQVHTVSSLARQLREELEKNGEHVLSIESLQLARKLETEAKKLRKEARR